MTEDEAAFQQMRADLASDLNGQNGPEKQVQAILDEVDAMLESELGALAIAGGEDIQVTDDEEGITIFAQVSDETPQTL